MVIAVLVLNYSGKKSAAAVFVGGLAVAATALFRGDVLGMEAMSVLQAGAGVLGIASKLPQILTVYQQGTTGQLSAFAVSGYISLFYKASMLILSVGVQLPCWITLAYLHYSSGS